MKLKSVFQPGLFKIGLVGLLGLRSRPRPNFERLLSSASHVGLCAIRSRACGRARPSSSGRPIVSSIATHRGFSTANNLNMRFVQFTCGEGGPQRLGAQLTQESDIIDISGVDSTIPNGLVQLLQGGPEQLDRAKRIVAEGKSVVPLCSACLLPPLTAPDKVICVGLNYRGHCEEQNLKFPKEPMFFSKFSSCIVGPYDSVTYPKVTTMLDYEVEFAIVIGKKTKDVKPEDALDHVFGYTVAQDISARDWQKSRNGKQWLLGKSMDQFCPLGPAVVTKESIADPHALGIRCKVNGVLKQDSNTNDLIHRVDHIVSFLSHVITLLPGDVILTGTPSGVGMFQKPEPVYLKVGDVIESEIERIGKMKNTIV